MSPSFGLFRSKNTNSTVPEWLSSRSNRKSVQRALQQRENTRHSIRALYMRGSEPPQELPREVYEHYATAASCTPQNSRKNRYVDIAPYDRTLVTFGSERYLNADWCLERYGKKYWIAAQATLPHTSHAFLSLLTAPISIPNGPSTRIRTVVQLTQLVENGRRKADAYFPSEVGQAVLQRPEPGYSGPPIVATLVERVDLPEACCIKSTVSLSFQDSNEAAVSFQHLLFTSWPDHGVPELQEQKHLMEFIQLVDKTNRNSSDDPDPPIVVGCSAGVGRTGTFIAVSSLLRAHGFLPPPSHPSSLDLVSPLGPLPHEEDEVAQEVDWLREQRPGMVQQQSQLELIYSLLESAFATEI